ncbi:MAG: hypothetical protein IT198_16495 [Acidimicrobiia bacterium]|nr:hypothetical protein [Acidimicrobiia bacterium]
MRRTRPGAFLLLLGGATLAGALALTGPVSADDTTVPEPTLTEAAEPVLDEVFDEVEVTTDQGGPDFDDPGTEVESSMSGTADGDTAVLYRNDYDDGADAHSETWIWDGRTQTWTEAPQTPATDPGVREHPAAAGLAVDDPTGDQALIYGGDAASGREDDTWVLDDNYEWYRACDPCNPGARKKAMGANSEWETFLFGGIDDTDTYRNDLWMWNGTTLDWDPVVPLGGTPSPRAGGAFAFDGADYILFGGEFPDGGDLTSLGDTWRLYLDADGNWWWELVPTTTAPSPRSDAAFAGLYWRDDPTPGAVLVGGYQRIDGPDDLALSDMWAWNGSEWILADPGTGTYLIDWSDPSTWREGVPYSPKAAAMPTIGAMVWTAGNCSPVTAECTRITEQINLTRDLTRPAVAGLPFTGQSRLDYIAALALILIAAGATAGIAGRRRRNSLSSSG